MSLDRRAICLGIAFAVVTAACSRANKSTIATSESSRLQSATPVSVYAHVGSFTVGVVTLPLLSGSSVEVWYPANGAVTSGSDTYDARSFLPPALQSRLAGKVHAYVSTDATRNVLVGAPGEQFPLVVFSHGYAGDRDQSTFLTTWLASWGMVVAAPEHPSRDLAHVLTAATAGVSSDIDDVRATITLMQRENARVRGPFQNRIEMSKIAVIGFDAGGRTAIAAAADPRVSAYVALASDNRLPLGSATAVTGGLPPKPSLFVGGTADHIVPAANVSAVYRAAPAPTYEWLITQAGHNAFTDQCIVAQAQGGLVALGDQSGIGSAFPASIRATLTGGCSPPALPVSRTWPVIDQVVTGFLRHFIGPDPTVVGVGPAGTRTLVGVKVTVSVRGG